MHVSKDEMSKFDIKSKRCIFIRYGQDEFGYKCYDQVERKVIRSRDVVFFESNYWRHWKGKSIQHSNRWWSYWFWPNSTKYATYGDASQQDEGREDVDEPVIIDNRVEANQDVILPLIGIEPREQTSLQEVVNNQTWWSTRERQPSMRYPSLIYEGQPISFMMF